MANILLLEHNDSFTYNLVDLLKMQRHDVYVYRTSVVMELILAKLQQLERPILILAAAAGTPSNTIYFQKIVSQLCGTVPTIGIGLGYLAIIEAYGGRVSRSHAISHAQACLMRHDNYAMFTGLPNPLKVARYDSWSAKNIPRELSITAQSNSMVMAFRHIYHRICGFQFHPESILTPDGGVLLKQTINWIQELE